MEMVWICEKEHQWKSEDFEKEFPGIVNQDDGQKCPICQSEITKFKIDDIVEAGLPLDTNSPPNEAYEVYLHHEFKMIGFQLGSKWGGVVTDPNGNDVVGLVLKNSTTQEFYLRADKPHHTGKQWNGNKVSVDSRPSKRFYV